MNKPYVKKYEVQNVDNFETKVLVNPISKDNPYIHNSKSSRGKSKGYKLSNNRANTCKRKNKHSRNYILN